MSDGESKLSVLGHLHELRRRLIRSVIAVAIGTPLSKSLAGVPGFIPPGWIPDTLNPLVLMDPGNPFSGVTLAGNWGI